MLDHQEILYIWSPYVTSIKLRRGGKYFYESMVECPIVVSRVTADKVTKCADDGVPDEAGTIILWNDRFFRPIRRPDGTACVLNDLKEKPSNSLIGRLGAVNDGWWLHHPAALYLTDEDLPSREPVLGPPGPQDWWGNPALIKSIFRDTEGAERRAALLNGAILIVDSHPMRQCYLPGTRVRLSEHGLDCSPWVYPYPEPFALFSAYLPAATNPGSLFLPDGEIVIPAAKTVDPEREAARLLANRCTLSAALYTVDCNLKSFDEQTAADFHEARPDLLDSLARPEHETNSALLLLSELMTNSRKKEVCVYGQLLEQVMATTPIDDEDLSLFFSSFARE
jgi:hypothetical protein